MELVYPSSPRANTIERTNRIGTLTIFAETGDGLTFIDIHTLSGVYIFKKSGLRANQLIRAFFTWMTPRHAYCRTAQLFRTNYTF